MIRKVRWIADIGTPPVFHQHRGSGYAFTTLLLVGAFLTPTGFREPLLFWNVAVVLAGAYVCGQLFVGRWPFPRFDALGGLLLGASAISSCQLLLADLDAPFNAWSGLLFWTGSFLLLVLANDAVVWAGRPARRRVTWRLLLPAGLALLFTTSLLSGNFSGQAPRLAALLRSGLGGAAPHEQLLWWPFLYRNHLAALVVLSLPWLLWQVMSIRTGSRVDCWRAGFSSVAAVTGMAAVLASGSRSGLLLVAAEIVLFLVISSKQGSGVLAWRSRPRLLVVGAMLTVLLAMAIGLGRSTTLEYRMRAHGPLLEGRMDYWGASVEMIRQRPFSGWGFGAWPDIYRQFQERDSGLRVNRAHSDWLEWTADGGIGIAFLLAVVMVGALRRAWRYPWALGLPMLFTYGMGDYVLRQPLVWLGFLVLWLLVNHASATNRAEKQVEADGGAFSHPTEHVPAR